MRAKVFEPSAQAQNRDELAALAKEMQNSIKKVGGDHFPDQGTKSVFSQEWVLIVVRCTTKLTIMAKARTFFTWLRVARTTGHT